MRSPPVPVAPRPTLRLDLLLEELEQLGDGDAPLLCGVAVAQRHRAVPLERFEVDGDAEGRTRLVHAPVAPADGAGGVVLDVVAALQLLVELVGLGHELRLVLDERQHRRLDRREARVQLEQRARLAADLVLAVGRSEHGQHEAVDADARLDDVRHVPG